MTRTCPYCGDPADPPVEHADEVANVSLGPYSLTLSRVVRVTCAECAPAVMAGIDPADADTGGDGP